MFRKLLATPDDRVLTLLRLALGIVFFAHGAQKMLGWFGGPGYSGTMRMFEQQMHIPAVFAFLAILAEFFGGLGLLIGLLTRVAAFGIAVNMAVAIGLIHRHVGFFMNWNGTQQGEGFEFHLLALAALALVMIRGAGAYSLDHVVATSPSHSLPQPHPAHP